MNNSVGWIGIGQGGSSVADEACKHGFYSCAINYSSSDLQSLHHIKDKLTLIGSEGVGRDRNIAIELMNSNWGLATEFVKRNFSHPSIEVIFVSFSTAGGSGSGLSPILLSMLIELMPEKVFVAVPILPDKYEVYKNQQNCIETFEDLSQLDICILPIDNEQVRTNMSNGGRVGLYRNINEKVINLIKTVVEYTEKPTQYSVLDKKDFLSIFKTKGFATISDVNTVDLSNEFAFTEDSFVEKIQNSWDNSPFVKIETDQIISAGIIFDGQERLLDCLNMRKLFFIFGNEMPLNLFEGIYSHEKGRVISILSGLSLCKSRLSQIESIIESSQTGNISTNTNHVQYVSKIKKINHQVATKTPPTTRDISDMISKFRR